MLQAKRDTILDARRKHISENRTVVCADNVKCVDGHFPLKFDGKVTIKALRFKELHGFLCLQQKHCGIVYPLDTQGLPKDGVNALKALLEKKNTENHVAKNGQNGNLPKNIEVVLGQEGRSSGEEEDEFGEIWTIDKVHNMFTEKNNKKRGE